MPTKSLNAVTISVIIPCWNGAELLPRCLAALAAQTFRDFEVILVDNASTDDAVADITERFSALNVRLERLSTNRGFAAANNVGARLARGTWLALLNQDAFPQPDWLARLMEATRRHPAATFFTSRLIQANDASRLDGAGDAYHISGLAWRCHYDDPIDTALIEVEVFSACAAAALYPREAFWRVGGFDEDFFCYHEDVDLGFRLRLQGYRCWYIPDATVYHVGASGRGRKTDSMIYYGHRNLVWTYIKNMPSPLFWRYLLIHGLMTLWVLFYFSLRGKGPIIWRAKFDAFRKIPLAWSKRQAIQRTRRVSPDEIRRVLSYGWLKRY